MLAFNGLLCLLLAATFEPVAEPAAQADSAFAYFPEPPRTTVLLFTGDNLPAARMAREIDAHGVDYPYQHVAELLNSGDLCFGNLECPITSHDRKTPGKSWESIKAGRNFIFKADPAYSAALLKAAGFDVLSLANNHAMDYCAAGLEDTLCELDGAGLVAVGAGLERQTAAAPAICEKSISVVPAARIP